jgi:transmembrane sensor
MSTASDLEAQAATWLIRREAPDFTAEESAAFDAWLAADARHRAAYLRLEAAWRRADLLSRLRPLDGTVDENLLARSPLARVEERRIWDERRDIKNAGIHVQTSESAGELSSKLLTSAPVKEHRRRLFVLATVIAVLCIVAGVWFAFFRSGWQEYTTDFGGLERIPLEDGSVVHLNTNSAIRVKITHNHRKVVLDRGEALFKVARDPSRPFDVQAAGTTVRAVGTEFSVRVREAEETPTGQKGVEVLVRAGRVAIDPPAPKTSEPAAVPPKLSTLSAGEAITVTAKRVHVHKVADADVSRKLSWVEGRLWFERQRLADVVAEFNRYNRRQMVIADPSIADLRIAGGFEATDPDSFIAALERTLGIRALPAPPAEGGPDVIRLVRKTEDIP